MAHGPIADCPCAELQESGRAVRGRGREGKEREMEIERTMHKQLIVINIHTTPIQVETPNMNESVVAREREAIVIHKLRA